MKEILDRLKEGQLVLDLGCGAVGSFPESSTKGTVIRMDADWHKSHLRHYCRADSAALPFPANCFDAVIANHTLEHFENLGAALAELKRVMKAEALLFVSVPDAATFSDKLYRWLARGGGHVNAFTDHLQFAAMLSDKTEKKLQTTRLLYASFSFLNRANSPQPRPKRLWLVGGGFEWTLKLAQIVLYWVDRMLGTRWRVYGWAFYLGPILGVDPVPMANMCVRCGSAHNETYLKQMGAIVDDFPRKFRCPNCGTVNVGLWPPPAHWRLQL